MSFRGTANNLVFLKGKTLVRDMGQKLAKFGTQIKKDDILRYLDLFLKSEKHGVIVKQQKNIIKFAS